MIIRRLTINSFCRIKIPELIEGDNLSGEGKYNMALSYYSRVVQIMDSAKMNKTTNPQYLQAMSKLSATQFLLSKYKSSQKLVSSLQIKNMNEQYKKYFIFLNWSCQALINEDDKLLNSNSKQQQQIKQIVYKLVNKEIKETKIDEFPTLWAISQNINNGIDYKKLLKSLVERSPKAQKSQKPKDQYIQLINKGIHSEISLLYYMSLLLQNKLATTSDKQLINTKINQILKQYEKKRPKQVYKPLINIIMSLIGQKQYMSAQGMVGHIKTSQMTLVTAYDSQDKNLINNIYRMLVTRAHNQPIQLGWSKEAPVLLGNLVLQRIIKTPLQNHSIDKLIC